MTPDEKRDNYENRGIKYLNALMNAKGKKNFNITQKMNDNGTVDEFARYDAVITQYNADYTTTTTIAENKIRNIPFEQYDTLTLSTKKFANDTHSDVYCMWYPKSDKAALITYDEIKHDQESDDPKIKVKQEWVLKYEMNPDEGFVYQSNFRIPKDKCHIYSIKLD